MRSETKDYYDDFSTWYENERHHGYHAMLDKLELDVLAPLAMGCEVLEVGCGTGLLMNQLKQRARRITGLDLSTGMLKGALDRGLNAVQGSAVKLPFSAEQFDLVYSVKVLAHIPEIRDVLGEMSRVLRPGGYLVAEFYNAQSIRYWAKQIGGPQNISNDRTEADVFTRWDTPEQVLSYLPPELAFKTWRGVRVLTPSAGFFKLPLADRWLFAAERLVMTSPLAKFGGFLMAVCQKR